MNIFRIVSFITDIQIELLDKQTIFKNNVYRFLDPASIELLSVPAEQLEDSLKPGSITNENFPTS
jgi:hypothetical protein